MTIKRTITVEVEMTSGASEASLENHIDDFVSVIKYHSENMRGFSWYKKINTSHDEQESVEINLTITDQ
jgi:hypothetical protein